MSVSRISHILVKKMLGGDLSDLRNLLLTWICPGLGHIALGQVRRGLILAVAINGLFLSGLLIGGVGVVDYSLNRAWFLGQMFNGPAVALEVVRSKSMMVHPNANIGSDDYLGTPENPNAYEPSFGRPNEIGILYAAIAGLLNLLIFYDVLDRSAQSRPGDKPKASFDELDEEDRS
jgi:hypothetical protein